MGILADVVRLYAPWKFSSTSVLRLLSSTLLASRSISCGHEWYPGKLLHDKILVMTKQSKWAGLRVVLVHLGDHVNTPRGVHKEKQKQRLLPVRSG